jgi:hypothetical protein
MCYNTIPWGLCLAAPGTVVLTASRLDAPMHDAGEGERLREPLGMILGTAMVARSPRRRRMKYEGAASLALSPWAEQLMLLKRENKGGIVMVTLKCPNAVRVSA